MTYDNVSRLAEELISAKEKGILLGLWVIEHKKDSGAYHCKLKLDEKAGDRTKLSKVANHIKSLFEPSIIQILSVQEEQCVIDFLICHLIIAEFLGYIMANNEDYMKAEKNKQGVRLL